MPYSESMASAKGDMLSLSVLLWFPCEPERGERRERRAQGERGRERRDVCSVRILTLDFFLPPPPFLVSLSLSLSVRLAGASVVHSILKPNTVRPLCLV